MIGHDAEDHSGGASKTRLTTMSWQPGSTTTWVVSAEVSLEHLEVLRDRLIGQPRQHSAAGGIRKRREDQAQLVRVGGLTATRGYNPRDPHEEPMRAP